MLVQLERYSQERELPEELRFIAVNPEFVYAVVPSEQHEGATIIRSSDGRGLLVRGCWNDVMIKIHGHSPFADQVAS
jgi:hypothetical protein